MDIGRVLDHLKAESFREVEQVAKEGDAARVHEIDRRLQVIERLSSQYADLMTAVGALQERGGQPTDVTPVVFHARINELSPKAYAKRVKGKFLEELKATTGANLQLIHGVIYQAPSGAKVGLAFSTEGKPGRWFCGLPEGAFDQALLLCEAQCGGEIIALSLGKEFLTKYGGSLSRSSNQVKFNVVRQGSSFVVVVPNVGRVNVDACRNNYEEY